MRDPSTTHGIAITHFCMARWQGVKVYVEKFVLKTESFKNTLSLKITVESHIARVNDPLSSVHRALNILIDSIANVRKGILQPQVIPPSLLLDAFM
jgi:hypothetical protein